MTTEPAATFDIFSPAFREDPYPTYAALRDRAPVHLTPAGFWTVSRYDDVAYVLKNPTLFSSEGMGGGGGGGMIPGTQVRTIINTDPPRHTAIRNLVNRAFTPRMVADLEPRIREITAQLIDRVAPTGSMDMVDDLAMPLPVTVIAEILGVETDRLDDFKRWSNAVVNGITAAEAGVDRARDREEFADYFSRAVDDRRAHPKDDLISAIIRASDAEVTLTGDELVAFAMLLLIAGNETTTNLLGNAMLALTDYTDQMQKVIDDPALVPALVEEALRYDSPVQFLFRSTTQDVELSDTKIPARNMVVPIYASANRDERRFPDPDVFDVTRNAQGHLAFGLGPHFCLGAPLARLEAKVALEQLLARLPNIRRAAPPTRMDSIFLRGLTHLPLTFEPPH